MTLMYLMCPHTQPKPVEKKPETSLIRSPKETSNFHYLKCCFSALRLFPLLFSGTDGTISCLASYLVCNAIFSSIMAHAGDINVRKSYGFPYLLFFALITASPTYSNIENQQMAANYQVCLSSY